MAPAPDLLYLSSGVRYLAGYGSKLIVDQDHYNPVTHLLLHAMADMVTILHHETDTTRGRSYAEFMRVPRSWVEEDGMAAGERTMHRSGYCGSDINQSCVLRRFGASALNNERLNDKDREELRKVVPTLPDKWTPHPYCPEAGSSMKDEEWHTRPVYCVYVVECS